MSTQLQFKTNLHCGSCVAKVKPHLDGEPSVDRWDVDTAVPDKVLTVEGDAVAADAVKAAVARAGFQVLGEIRPAAVASPPDPSVVSPITYYPLAFLAVYLVGATALGEVRAGTLDWERAMQHFMGAFFLAFSFFKLLDLSGFADAYRMYDVVAERVPAYGYVYPFIELALGAAYLAGFQPFATNLVTLIVMSISTIGVVQSVLARKAIRCACLGSVFNLPMTTVTIVEDGLMVAMAAAMLLFGSHS